MHECSCKLELKTLIPSLTSTDRNLRVSALETLEVILSDAASTAMENQNMAWLVRY